MDEICKTYPASMIKKCRVKGNKNAIVIETLFSRKKYFICKPFGLSIE